MSTKAEQEGAVAASTVERPPQPIREGEAPATGHSPPLASIIIDPSATETTSGNGASFHHDDARVVERAAAPQSPPRPAAPAADMSMAEADRFAANFRPSWEPAAPAAAVSTAKRMSQPAATPRPVAAVVVPQEPDPDISEFPGARQRKRALMMAAAAVGGFVALAALAFMSSRATPPPAASSAKEESHVAQPAEPHPSAPAAAAAPPIAPVAPPIAPVAPLPTPTAAAPTAATPTAATEAPAPLKALAGPIETAAPSPAPERPAEQPTSAPIKRAEQPTLVHIRVATNPEDAELSLDGARVPNPFETGMPKSGKHRLTARAPGYHSSDLNINFDHDQDVTLRLDKARSPKPSRTATPQATVAARAHRSPPPARQLAAPVAPPARPSGTKGAGFVTESPY